MAEAIGVVDVVGKEGKNDRESVREGEDCSIDVHWRAETEWKETRFNAKFRRGLKSLHSASPSTATITFAVNGELQECHYPGIVVDMSGALTIPLPISDTTLATLEDHFSTRIDSENVKFNNPAWSTAVETLCKGEIKEKFGMGASFRAKLVEMAIHSSTIGVKRARITKEKTEAFGRLLIYLPTETPCEGGGLGVRHPRNVSMRKTFEHQTSPYSIEYIAFLAECDFDVLPITSGHRVVLIYDLVLDRSDEEIAFDDAAMRHLKQLVDENWDTEVNTKENAGRITVIDPEFPFKVVPTSHIYPVVGAELRDHDRTTFNALVELGFEVALVNLTKYAAAQENCIDDHATRVRYGLDGWAIPLTGGSEAAAVCQNVLSTECSSLPRGHIISSSPYADPFSRSSPVSVEMFDPGFGDGPLLDYVYRRSALVFWPKRENRRMLLECSGLEFRARLLDRLEAGDFTREELTTMAFRMMEQAFSPSREARKRVGDTVVNSVTRFAVNTGSVKLASHAVEKSDFARLSEVWDSLAERFFATESSLAAWVPLMQAKIRGIRDEDCAAAATFLLVVLPRSKAEQSGVRAILDDPVVTRALSKRLLNWVAREPEEEAIRAVEVLDALISSPRDPRRDEYILVLLNAIIRKLPNVKPGRHPLEISERLATQHETKIPIHYLILKSLWRAAKDASDPQALPSLRIYCALLTAKDTLALGVGLVAVEWAMKDGLAEESDAPNGALMVLRLMTGVLTNQIREARSTIPDQVAVKHVETAQTRVSLKWNFACCAECKSLGEFLVGLQDPKEIRNKETAWFSWRHTFKTREKREHVLAALRAIPARDRDALVEVDERDVGGSARGEMCVKRTGKAKEMALWERLDEEGKCWEGKLAEWGTAFA